MKKKQEGYMQRRETFCLDSLYFDRLSYFLLQLDRIFGGINKIHMHVFWGFENKIKKRKKNQANRSENLHVYLPAYMQNDNRKNANESNESKKKEMLTLKLAQRQINFRQ